MTETVVPATPILAEPAPLSPRRRHRSATRRLVTSELRLLMRDPFTLTFVLVFPS
jgi:ABC-2 type transport system permease protein